MGINTEFESKSVIVGHKIMSDERPDWTLEIDKRYTVLKKH